jgi:hypothetical protein
MILSLSFFIGKAIPSLKKRNGLLGSVYPIVAALRFISFQACTYTGMKNAGSQHHSIADHVAPGCSSVNTHWAPIYQSETTYPKSVKAGNTNRCSPAKGHWETGVIQAGYFSCRNKLW